MVSSLSILTFHSLDDGSSVVSFPPRLFERGMARLHDSGYRTIELMAARACVVNGAPLPERSFVITFDDGYQSVYEEAFRVLQRHGMSATIFLAVGEARTAEPAGRLPSLNGRSMLSWSEIREMQSSGITFGAHTLTHPDLTKLSLDAVESEILESKEIIQDTLGAPVASFAYPFGHFDVRSLAVVREHFDCACSDKLGLVNSESDLYALERVDAYYLRTDRLFDITTTRLFPFYVGARSIPRRIRRALQRRWR